MPSEGRGGDDAVGGPGTGPRATDGGETRGGGRTAPEAGSPTTADGFPNRWVGRWAERRARLSPDATGLVDATTGASFTYAALSARANRTARLLETYDVSGGGRVAVLSRNRPELVDLFFATGLTGGVLAPLSHRLAPPELATLLSTVAPELLVVEAPLADLAREALAAEGCTVSPPVLALGDRVAGTDATPEGGPDVSDPGDATGRGTRTSDSTVGTVAGFDAYAAALPTDDGPVDRADVDLSDPHLLLHTGGSTGTPKETVLSHRSVLWNSFNTITAWGLRPSDATPMVFPMFHTGGWNVITVPLFHLGGTVVIAREVAPGDVLGVIERHDATVLIAVPAVLRGICRHDDWAETDLSTLRFAKSGGGPCRESVMSAWWDRGVDLSQGYGLTECGPNNFAMPDGWQTDREKAEGVGVPAMHVDARVVDDDGTELPAGEVGELEVSGPAAADGYLDAPEESAATFGDGWVSTGDLARVDDDGHFHIEGRKKNMYVSGGENVYPPEVEDAVAAHPAVEEVIVIAVPDDRWGQVGRAVYEGDPGLSIEEVREFLGGRLARFKHPKSVVHVDAIPTSGPSKLDREAVRDRWAGTETDGDDTGDDEVDSA